MSVVSDLYTYLEAEGIAGGSTGWDLMRRRETDTPASDQLVVLSEDGGPEPEIAEASGIGDSALKDIGVQAMVRAGAWDGDASATKAQAIVTALHGEREITVGLTTYMRVRARTAEPVFVGFDALGRPRHTVAFLFLELV